MRLFLSYSRRDAAYAERLRAGLEEAGHDVWIDRDDIAAGEQWRASIVEGITGSDAVVLVVSPPSMASDHVLREVSLAAESRKPLYPVRLVRCDVTPAFRYLLAGIQLVDVERAGEPGALAQLLAALGGALPPPQPPLIAPTSRPSRRGLVVGAGAAAVVAAVGIALTRRGGGDGGGSDVLDATAGLDDLAADDRTGAGRPPDETVEYTERLGWFGDENLLFGIQLRSATLRPTPGDATRRELRVEALAGNPSSRDQSLVELPAPAVVVGDQQVSTFLDFTGEVPGSGTSAFAITATMPSTFTLAAASLVFGNAASNRTVMPLDGTSPIETTQPSRGFAVGAVADGGLTQTRVVESLAWPNYAPGRRGEAWIELVVDVSYAGAPTTGNYDTVTWYLVFGDGSRAGAEMSFVFGDGLNGIVEPGRWVRSGLRFAVNDPPTGVYTLVVASQQAAFGNPDVRDATVEITVP